ncbi:RHS repeat-associated core domain-containing protein, partial [Saccharomonospora azurea]|uniref:RHS repeat-associated core domain-containing protein n=1 Tax=Saccharomonospora azurea TaxID=40988 RepID=UPI0020D2472E
MSAQTGTFTWSYPMRVPPAPGGLAPEVSLSYSSAAVDGLTSATNTQAGWAGDGWAMWPGFVERSYTSCATDLPGEPEDNPADLCWDSDNATVSINGAATRLVKDSDTGTWRPEHDDGSRVQRLTGADSPDNNGEYWKITTVDGTQYFYGSRSGADSTWTVPVFGDDSGEPCHAAEFKDSFCDQAYRWNLDKVVDTNGNVIHYEYETATNKYGRNKNEEPTEYVREGWLKRIDYGLREGENIAPTGRVDFTVADRCVPGSTCTREKEENWPDVPWHLECDGTTCEDYQQAPTFWSTKRLAKITTQVRDGDGYRAVDSWTLRHEFPDPGDGEKPTLWLAAVRHTGHVGDDDIQLPEVTFEGIAKPNRVHGIDGHAALIRYRMNAIVSEAGGVISIDYAEADCSAESKPTKPETNTRRCFPVTWSAPYSAERTDYFHKYVVASVSSHDRIASSVPQVARYEYLDGAAWHYTTSELVDDEDKTWNEFRGFERVRIRQGSGDDGPVTLTEERYFRGMDGDEIPGGSRSVTVEDSEGGKHTDHDWLAGSLLESTTYSRDGGEPITKVITEPTWQGPTATRGTLKAYLVDVGTERTYTKLESGEFRVTRKHTTYDDKGMPTEVNDLGDVSDPADDLCTRTSYVRNTQKWLFSLPSQEETVSVACSEEAGFPGDAVSGVRYSYDGQAFGTAPSRGNVTTVAELTDDGGKSYVTATTRAYDAHGRVTEERDALDRATTMSYTPAADGPLTKTVVTNAKGHETTTTYNPAWGRPTKVVDANFNTTEVAYDALGRTVEVWKPNQVRPQGGNARYSYKISRDEPSVITTDTLGPNGAYVTSKQLFDGLLRVRQVQQPAFGGGRLLTDTRYDSAGRAYYQTKPYFNDAPVDDTLWSASDAEVPGLTTVEYDGVGRPVAEVFKGGGIEKWRATTSYGGDRVHVTPPDGGTPTTAISDARGRMIELRQYHGDTPEGEFDNTTYRYDPAGNLTGITDPGGNAWEFDYDLRGRQVQMDDPDKGVTTKKFDAAGQLVETTDARGETLAIDYDVLGRKTAVHEGSLDGPKRAEWAYDTAEWGIGRLASSTRYVDGEAYVRKTSVYDALYQPLKTQIVIPESEEGLGGTYTTAASYRPDGSLGGIGYAEAGDLSEETYSLIYDDLGFLRTSHGGLSGQGNTDYVTDTQYTRYGELQRTQLGKQGQRVWLSRYYHEHTRRLARTIVDAELPKPMQSDTRYSYDPAGNVTSIADAPLDGLADVQCFRYDHLRRLVEAWTPTGDCTLDPAVEALGGPAPYWHSFAYDEVGNRMSQVEHTSDGDTVHEYAYPDGGHALESVTSQFPSGSTTLEQFAYDESGNTVRRTSVDGEQTLEWDAEGNLVKSTKDEVVTEFLYDADGQRLIRRDPDGATLYLEGQELRWDRESGETTTTRYYSFGDSTVAMRTEAGLTWLLGDHQGTSQFAVDAQSMQVTRRWQLPFGGPRGPEVEFPGEKGFVGGTIDDSADFVTLGARQYAPELGRFLSVDPLMDPTDPQQMHGYTYSNNSPITYSDPSGLFLEWFTKVVSSAVKVAKRYFQR